MPPVGAAITAVKAAIVGYQVARARAPRSGSDALIADAVRPSVIGVDAHTPAEPPLCRQNQPVVTLSGAVVDLVHISDQLSVLRPLQVEDTPLIQVSGRVAAGGDTSGASANRKRARDDHAWVE